MFPGVAVSSARPGYSPEVNGYMTRETAQSIRAEVEEKRFEEVNKYAINNVQLLVLLVLLDATGAI